MKVTAIEPNLLWNMDGSDLRCSNHLTLPAHQILKEIYSDVIVRRQVDADFSREEVVDLPFGPVLRGELLLRYRSHLGTAVFYLFHIAVLVCHLLSVFA